MIKKVFSDLPSFRALSFTSGLNILVAERHQDATARDTRNGTGKTSFIELLHLVIQERKNKDDDFHKPEIVGHNFGVNFWHEGQKLTVERKTAPDREKDQAFLNAKPIELKVLRQKLAAEWFNLTSEDLDDVYAPKFGALFSYFVRKERNGGFASPALNSSVQRAWDSQINLAYLLGFDWRLIQTLQHLKDEKKAADTLSTIVKGGFLSGGMLDANKMQSRVDVLENEVEVRKQELAKMHVVDGYRRHEEEANELSRAIRDLNENNLEDLDLKESIDIALKEVDEIRERDLKSVYDEAGVFFGDQVVKRFDQVLNFHRQVAKNRKAQLAKESARASERLKQRRKEIDVLQGRLTEKLALLRSGVALERVGALQSDLLGLETELADLRQQLPKVREINETKIRLKREIEEQVELIGDDVQSREEARKFAVQAFAEVSRHLYDEPGNLVLGRSKGSAGLEIDTDIVGKKSGGKSHMQIFCFDWVLVEAAKKRDLFPGFLVHDSHIFDGVDGRQIGLALDFAAKKCAELGIQYIVAMNSDDLEKVKNEERASGEKIFDPDQYIIETRLNDDESGGLFGLRF